MRSVFIQIFNMSLTGTLTILAVMLLRLPLRRAPRIFSYGLWAVVLFRLLCPVSFESAFSLLGVLHAPTAETGVIEYLPDAAGGAVFGESGRMEADGAPVGADAFSPAGEPGAEDRITDSEKLGAFWTIGGAVWLAGAAAMLLWGMASYGRLSRRLKGAEEYPGGNGRIRYTDEVSMPFVLGVVRPCIYLPKGLSGKDLEYILLHEKIHIKRGDPWTRMAAYAALCLHWFNPMVWLAFFLSGRDMEMSCDEAVLGRVGNQIKKEYSASLLSLACGRRIPVGGPLAFGEGEPGSRIKNVLRYRKPALALVLAVLAVCVAAAVFLLGNPRREALGEQVFYGVIKESPEYGYNVVVIPGEGEFAIPDAEKAEPYIEMDFNGLEPGQLVRIAFSGADGTRILPGRPMRFDRSADSIEVMGVGFDMEPAPGGGYLFSVPLGMAPQAREGDLLRIFHVALKEGDLRENYHLYLLQAPEKIETLTLAETRIVRVDPDNYDIWVTLSDEEAAVFLAEFGFGVSCELESPLPVNDPEKEQTQTVQKITREMELSGEVPDGSYWVYARSVSRSARCFDRHAMTEAMPGDESKLVPTFSDDCVFYVNREMNRVSMEETDFTEFADLAGAGCAWQNVPVLCVFREGLITKASLMSSYLGQGISYQEPESGAESWFEEMCRREEKTPEEMLEEYYELSRTEEADVSDAPGTERIEIYLGNIGDGNSGVALVYDEAGELLHVEDAHHARAGWNNVYAGDLDGTPYLMTMHIEDREVYGEYWYQVFRLGEAGELRQIAGSDFQWGEEIQYDDGLFHQWADQLENYLAHSHLLLTSQEGELRTEAVSEAEKYHYGTLHR